MHIHNHIHPCHPLQCIIPPHMVESLKLRGSAQLKKMSMKLEKSAENFRVVRDQAAPPSAFMAAPVLNLAEAKPKSKREVYDASNGVNLPGTLARKEGGKKSKDPVVNDAYIGAGDTYKLYLNNYGRDSLDGHGMKLISTVHFDEDYNNAFWNGDQMVYGDGDGIIFKPLTGSRSVIGHELSHGVVQFSGGLNYRDQSGALNESFADVFGCLTVQYKKKQSVCEADWLVGDGILGPDINGDALRSMKAPGTAYDDDLLGKDPQPYHMSDYVVTSSDNGGVHINSGIPNHAFDLLAQYLGGNAWERAGQIWYDTLQAINNPMATFSDWADKTVEMAQLRYGIGSIEVIMTRRAWKLVGITL